MTEYTHKLKPKTKVTTVKAEPLSDSVKVTKEVLPKPAKSEEQAQTDLLRDAARSTNQDPNAPAQEPVYIARPAAPPLPTTAKDIKHAIADIADRLDRSRTLSATPDVAIAEAVKALRDIAGVEPA